MRHSLMVSALVPLAFVMGCGVNMQNTAVSTTSMSMGGKVMGGQAPIVGALIQVISYGTAGYGTRGVTLGSATTDADGNFQIPSYTCPTASSTTTDQVYILSTGGAPGGVGSNPAATLSAALGSCSTAQGSFVTINEVTTAAMAIALSHFFTTTYGTSSGDAFGADVASGSGPGNLNGLVLANETADALVNYHYGQVLTIPGANIEGYKLYGIANILASCVNSQYTTNTNQTVTGACGKLFTYTTNSGPFGTGGQNVSDTLQAAVQMALNPTSNVAQLTYLTPPEVAFDGGFNGVVPYDFSIGVSYTTSTLGVAVPDIGIPSLDIDASNRIWFASDAPGSVGVAYFDPSTSTFSGPFNSTGMVEPTQVAIDPDFGVAFANDQGSGLLSGYLVAGPNLATSENLPGYFSTALTIDDDGSVNVGVVGDACTTGGDCTGYLAYEGPANSYAYGLQSGVPGYAYSGTVFYPATSMAGGATNGEAITETAIGSHNPNSVAQYINDGDTNGPQPAFQLFTTYTTGYDAGQVAFTGNDFVSPAPYSGTGSASTSDQLCIFSNKNCYPVVNAGSYNGSTGIAIDGGGTLWLAADGADPNSSFGPEILEVPVANSGATQGNVYLTGGQVAAVGFPHGPNYGGTMVEPYGIGVDAAGNVWALNAGCVSTSSTLCTPGALVLSELVGSGTPTVTPIAAGYTGATILTGTRP